MDALTLDILTQDMYPRMSRCTARLFRDRLVPHAHKPPRPLIILAEVKAEELLVIEFGIALISGSSGLGGVFADVDPDDFHILCGLARGAGGDFDAAGERRRFLRES